MSSSNHLNWMLDFLSLLGPNRAQQKAQEPSEPLLLMKSFTPLATSPLFDCWLGRLLCWLAQVQQTLMAQCPFPF